MVLSSLVKQGLNPHPTTDNEEVCKPKKEIRKASFIFNSCPREEEKTFKTSACILPISYAKKETEGKYLDVTLKLVNKKEFAFCSILIVDTLARHTLKIDRPNESDKWLRNTALKNGTEWWNRNEQTINQLTMKYAKIRWDDILNHKDFNSKHAQVIALYNADNDYKEAIHYSAREFLHRKIKKYFNFDITENIKILKGEQQQEAIEQLGYKNYSSHFNLCITYLIEEAAGFCLYASPPLKKHRFEIYHPKRTAALASTYEKLIIPEDPDVLKYLSLRFE